MRLKRESMATKKKKIQKRKLLSNTRPTTLKPHSALSSRTARTLIRSHHTLQKQLSHALASNDTVLATSLHAQIDAQGGLESYQRASILGQSATRGGDSSKVLIDWLVPLLNWNRSQESTTATRKYRLLEVGALSIDNACSRSGIFDVERIDLHSQHPAILEQDFLQRPSPKKEVMQEEGFDVVSLSLVVNYVGDATERGEMLRRVGSFLRVGRGAEREGHHSVDKAKDVFPALFLVLPAPCVLNSRYCDDERLGEMMSSEGYELLERKKSKKLVYYLWRYTGMGEVCRKSFGKIELMPGGARNNFCIIMQ
ncbi:hypothetical protein MMC30_005106 [Trapelia coarctata]|nr:hypothetical protein [Trapelia coarctata]